MTMLMRFDPFRELDRLTQAPWGTPRPAVPMDAYRRNGDFVVHFDVPGVDPASIDLTVEKNVLTVTAERQFPRQHRLIGSRQFSGAGNGTSPARVAPAPLNIREKASRAGDRGASIGLLRSGSCSHRPG